MAAAEPTPEPEIANKVVAALVGALFALIVLGGFAAATAASYDNDTHADETHLDDGDGHDDDGHGDDHDDDHDNG
ncbi:MAG: hypothetical protein ACR2P0_08600 [Acidimicrobiales bacterium]